MGGVVDLEVHALPGDNGNARVRLVEWLRTNTVDLDAQQTERPRGRVLRQTGVRRKDVDVNELVIHQRQCLVIFHVLARQPVALDRVVGNSPGRQHPDAELTERLPPPSRRHRYRYILAGQVQANRVRDEAPGQIRPTPLDLYFQLPKLFCGQQTPVDIPGFDGVVMLCCGITHHAKRQGEGTNRCNQCRGLHLRRLPLRFC